MSFFFKMALASMLALVPISVSAATFAIDYTGTIDDVFFSLDTSEGGLMVGDTYSARLVFDDQAAQYPSANFPRFAIVSLSLTFDGFDPVVTVLADPTSDASVVLINPGPVSGDGIEVLRTTGDVTSGGVVAFDLTLASLSSDFFDGTSLEEVAALPSDLIPLFPFLQSASFELAGNSAFGNCPPGTCVVSGTIDSAVLSVAAVPLPAGAVLLLTGLGAIFAFRRRRTVT